MVNYIFQIDFIYFAGLRKESDAFLKVQQDKILATSNLESNQIHYHIPAHTTMYTDPSSLQVYFEIEIQDKDGKPVPTGIPPKYVKELEDYRASMDMWESLDDDQKLPEDTNITTDTTRTPKPTLPTYIKEEWVKSCVGKVRLANDLASNMFSEVYVTINDKPMQVIIH